MADNFPDRLAQAKLATEDDTIDFVKKAYFDNKLKNLNKKVTSYKTKRLEAKKKLTDLTNKVEKLSEKGYDFLLATIYFIGDDSYENFLVSAHAYSSAFLIEKALSRRQKTCRCRFCMSPIFLL